MMTVRHADVCLISFYFSIDIFSLFSNDTFWNYSLLDACNFFHSPLFLLLFLSSPSPLLHFFLFYSSSLLTSSLCFFQSNHCVEHRDIHFPFLPFYLFDFYTFFFPLFAFNLLLIFPIRCFSFSIISLFFRLEEMQEYCESKVECRRKLFHEKFGYSGQPFKRCSSMCDNCRGKKDGNWGIFCLYVDFVCCFFIET